MKVKATTIQVLACLRFRVSQLLGFMDSGSRAWQGEAFGSQQSQPIQQVRTHYSAQQAV